MCAKCDLETSPNMPPPAWKLTRHRFLFGTLSSLVHEQKMTKLNLAWCYAIEGGRGGVLLQSNTLMLILGPLIHP